MSKPNTAEAPVAPSAQAPAVPPVRALQPARLTLHLAGQSWNIWDAIAEAGTPLEWLVSEEYWTHVGQKLALWDEIVVRLEDGSAKVRLTVQSAGKRYARVAIESVTELRVGKPSDLRAPAGYAVEWSGPHTKFRVRRGADVLRDGFDTEGQANQWLGTHLRAA